jgi:hypothetical protein
LPEFAANQVFSHIICGQLYLLPTMCCQSCFPTECAANYIFFQNVLLIMFFSQNVLLIMFSS